MKSDAPEQRSTGYDLHELVAACDDDVSVLEACFSRGFLLLHQSLPPEGGARPRTRRIEADEGEATGELTLKALPLWQPERQLERPDAARKKGIVCIGRLPGNDVTVVDDTVSKLHALCRATADGFFLLDAGSRNGTFIDDVAVPGRESAGVRLCPGQSVRLGSLSMSFVEAATLLLLARRVRRPDARAS